MILTVTLNFAVDVTYRVSETRPGAHNRVSLVGRRAGGKGVNVARVLHGLGREAVVTGFAGGANGRAARAELERSGLPDGLVAIDGESRVTIVIVEDSGVVTGFSELGPLVSEEEWQRFAELFGRLARGADAVVLSGSLPAGVPDDAYAQLISRARVPTLLDAEGAALELGIGAGPSVVKINAEELAGLAPGVDAFDGAARVLAAGASAVVVTSGADGMVGMTPDGMWAAAPPARLVGNPTGAGDAAAAALAVGMVDGSAWPVRLVNATALSAAAVAAYQAGSFDDELYRRWLGEVEVRELSTRSA